MNEALRIEGLHKSFESGGQRLPVLADLALHLAPGRMLAVMGASGSGKSTFLHLVGAMDRPDAGRIRFEGTEVTQLEARERARFRNEKIGFIFQFHHLLPEFTALENVMFPLLLRRLSPAQAGPRGRALLSELGLAERSHHRPGELSGGEQQRVAIARALVGSPRLLLGDEPTGNLDVHTSESIHRLLREIHDRHQLTSILVTHNPRLAEICDLRLEMVEGRLQPC